LEEREKYFLFKGQGLSLREIGRRLGRSHTTFFRESKRNAKYGVKYIPCKAQKVADRVAQRQRYHSPLKNPKVFVYVRRHLRKDRWSPEVIAGKLKIKHPDESIHHETIYRYIYSQKFKTRGMKLWQYLTYQRKRRMKKNGRSVNRNGRIPGSISIDLRPEIVAERSRGGDWESDNLGSPKTDKSALSVTVERLSRLTLLDKLTDRKAATKRQALTKRLSKYPKKLRLTLTEDNGSENIEHQQLSDDAQIDIFFCHAYHSWEKGTVENTNQRLRTKRYIPKGTSIDTLSEKQIKQIEHKLNSTPRKCLNYLTPYEKMEQLISGIT
jgi:transposase, IS30 family